MADTPCIALKKMFGKEWRHGWWVGSITLSETMAYWKNCWVWHTLEEDKDKKQVNKGKFKTGRTAGSGTPCKKKMICIKVNIDRLKLKELICLAHLVRPAQLHRVAQAVQEPDKMFFCNEGTSKIVLYLKLAWATHSLVIDSGTSSWSSLGSCTAGNLPPYMNFSWWANKARFTLKLTIQMAHHSIWSLPVPLGDQPCPVSPIHTHLLKSMFVSSRGPICKCSNRKKKLCNIYNWKKTYFTILPEKSSRGLVQERTWRKR